MTAYHQPSTCPAGGFCRAPHACQTRCTLRRGPDTLVFVRYHDMPPSPYNYDDSNQDDDPAYWERNR